MVSKVTKTIDLDKYGLMDVPQSDKKEAKIAVLDFLRESILDYVGEGNSPVQGQKAFKSYSKDYAKFKEGISSSGSPNLELYGDMLDSLEGKSRQGSVIEIGIFDGEQALKADNHNKFSSESKKTRVPKRQFIPYDDQGFKRSIESGILAIIKEFSDGE